ncbi:uncharacterized protein PgNI_02620 [Pyricularia grisea]|uniref:Enoyl reductase (ER) domain-containing protein n=1 Tax=Pyricularia grisea TaxID=148305 RepID=A0A6P8BHY3_PYRGI|nr:uncharacterized protein PgNI_02620 [Pyricularia grisea]TLD16229.1 hypothetical protein PgNI_02620 [Pyricularia grisea]
MVFLLELKKPVLDNLGEKEYEVIKGFSTTFQRLLWVICGDNPSFGIIDGLSRSIQSEIAGTKFQMLHLNATTGMQYGPFLAGRILSSEATRDNEFHERDGLLQVTRIYRSLAENNAIKDHFKDRTRITQIDSDANLRLTIERPGLLNTLKFIKDDRLAFSFANYQVKIKIAATGINFRDIMASMGLIPMLGNKIAGKFQIGNRVSFLGVGTHATKVRVNHNIVVKIPDTIIFQKAIYIPVCYITAYYTLVNLERLSKGKSILIHATAGGVGQAAVQIAKYLGATVYITVGSETKRKLLVSTYGILKDHIFNSRDPNFAKGIMRVTKGRGVDYILNSLSGKLFRASWEVLAIFGTFVKIGLRNIFDNSRLEMRPFGKNTTFTFFNQFFLYEHNPAVLGQLFSQVFNLIFTGTLRAPNPLTVCQLDKVQDAFRTIQQGKYIGKLVLFFPAADENATTTAAPVLRKTKDLLKLDPNVTYLFVGGLGGFGRSLARQFVISGARNLAFLSKSGDGSPDAQALIKKLSGRGAVVKAYRGNVADRASFKNALDKLESDFPPVKGVIQMAMALRDIVFEKMSHEWWRTGLRPKVQGIWNLYEYFNKTRPLDFFIIYSSILGLYGYPSQAQYSAGNIY